jgi:RNA polymerase-binding transcription factor
MNTTKLAELKLLLLKTKTELQQQEIEFKGDGEPVKLDQSKVGRLSRMDAMQIQQMALEASRRRQQQLLKIETTLKRMDSYDYGFCFHCDEAIDIRRLFIDPTNTHCIKCADI